MEKYDIYKDVEKRTDGDIYIGVVGPVRTGKSSFVSGFMSVAVIPNISAKSKRTIATDEMPQSGAGKTIMTTEPKFVPAEAVQIKISGGAKARVRLIDCAGYLVDGALGKEEDGAPRLVKTPWSDKEMPFEKAAETGTEKVIREHSTIGVAVTTDGSFTDIPRENYLKAEERVISELKEIGKPFVILLNVKNPQSESALKLAEELEKKYDAGVVVKNVLSMKEEDYGEVLSRVLFEFPVGRASVRSPEWFRTLPREHAAVDALIKAVSSVGEIKRMRDGEKLENVVAALDFAEDVHGEFDLGEGTVTVSFTPSRELYFQALSQAAGEEIGDDLAVIKHAFALKKARDGYEKLKNALNEAEQTGYGIVAPLADEISISQPEMVKTGGVYGVRIKASAPSIHIVKVDIDAEVDSVVGKEKQCFDYVERLKAQYEEDPRGVMQVDLFGRPLYSFVSDEIYDKAGGMKAAFREKLKKTVYKLVNEKKSALFCVTI